MNDIDFLPADYVCVQTTRTNDNWLRVLFVAVLGLMGIGWVAQQKSLGELTRRRNHAVEQANTVRSQLDSADDLHAELKRADNRWHLLNGLRCQVPPTRWLSAIVGALPVQVWITEIHSETSDGADTGRKNSSGTPRTAPGPDAPAEYVDRIQRDLDRLIGLTAQRSLLITVRGLAADDLEVSQFLNALHRSDLFERVQLLFTDQHPQGTKMLRAFAIRLRTWPLNNRPETRAASSPVATGQDRRPAGDPLETSTR